MHLSLQREQWSEKKIHAPPFPPWVQSVLQSACWTTSSSFLGLASSISLIILWKRLATLHAFGASGMDHGWSRMLDFDFDFELIETILG